MTESRRPAQRRATRIGNTDLCEGLAPVSGSPWIETALAAPDAILEDIAKCVADAAVFAAMEAISDQGVEGTPEFWQIDAVHRLITYIVVQRLLDISDRGRATMAHVVTGLIADAGDTEHENGDGDVTRLMLMDKGAPR